MSEGEPGELVFTVRHDQGEARIFRRQHWLPDDVAERLLPILDASPWLAGIAGQLRGCLTQIHMREAA